MKTTVFLVVTALAMLPLTARAAEPPKEPLVEQVRKAIEDGKKFLRQSQTDQGDWQSRNDKFDALSPHGQTPLALLALLTAGEKPTSPVVQRGLKYLREVKRQRTYTVSLQTMVYAEAGLPEDKLAIQDNVNWLIETAVRSDGVIVGWGYSGGRVDYSNTQYALLGLYAGKQAGAEIKREVWEQVQAFYKHTQVDGGWSYQPSGPVAAVSLTMTTAGLCGLLISGMELEASRRKLRADGSDPECGRYPEDEAVKKATKFVAEQFKLTPYPGHVFYNIYGMERAGRLSGQRFFGDHDWYREGCEALTSPTSPIRQHEDGSWALDHGYDSNPIVSTSMALLFLSKGRTPVLISKLVHGGDNSLAWNNKHNDCRNLVDYASTVMFKKQPLGWQVFNARGSQADVEELTGELLLSPIAYFNGHGAVIFQGREKNILKTYIEQGGFLLVEACCGDEDFRRGFEKLMKEKDMFNDREHPLKRLPPDHPIWTAHAKLAPSDDFPLEGMEFGCRTAIVFCPRAISGYWEINDRQSAKGKYAFELAGNIIAYATGMELPQPKLTKIEVPRNTGETRVKRGFFKVAQLKHTNDRHSTNGVLRNLMVYLRDKARVDVALQTQEMHANDPDVLEYKFIYMHGRGNFDIDDLDRLRANLKTGGLLFADACCGKPAFNESFRAFVKKLFPDHQLEPIKTGDMPDELFSKELNGSAITTVRCRREGGDAGFKEMAPELEGIKIDGRWVVIYSKYDIGCAVEKHQSSDCLGYDHASALRLGAAVVLYALR